MKLTGQAPDWAMELLTKVLKDYNRGVPTEFSWRHSAHKYSSGSTQAPYKTKKLVGKSLVNYRFWGKVHVRAGQDVDNQKLVLLHELAHHILNKTPAGRHQGHTIKFWRLAFELYDKYGVDMEYAIECEKDYKVKATQAYEQHMAKKAVTI